MENSPPVCTISVLCDRVGDAGGAERYWETLVPALTARGVDVHVMARDVGDAGRLGVDVVRVPWGNEHEPPSKEAAHRVSAELAKIRPDVVVTASVFDPAVLEAVRGGAPRWLARLHDHRAFCPNGDRVYPQFSAPCTAAMGAACRRGTLLHGCVQGPRLASFRAIAARERVRDRLATADAVLVSSEHMRATCATNGIVEGRIAIMPPPLRDEAYAPAPLARPAESALLFAARLTPQKGLRSLIGALARLQPSERPLLIVAGTGDEEQRAARAEAERSGVAVSWRGKLSEPALRAAIDEATAVAVPSLWPEPFGLIGIEAQARGRPAVAYRVGGIGEWLGDGGIAVPRGNQAALADAIRKVFDRSAWPAFSEGAWRRSQAYRLPAHVDRFLELCTSGLTTFTNGEQRQQCAS
jgi:glycosyltransferase involved in cell wall biosynthesis